MAEKILSTRIMLRYDSYENWTTNNPVLKVGEVAIATVASNSGDIKNAPNVLIKVGDGTSTYSALKFVSALAADVLTACKTETGLTTYITNVINNSGIATSDALTTLAGRVTTAESDIDALEAKVGSETVAKQISDAIAALDLANTYDTKGSAADALAEAKTYADGLNTAMDTRVKVLEEIDHEAYKGYADQAEADAKTYADGLNTAMNTRVEALESIDHNHSNKTVLDGITAEKVTAWDASEQNAKNYADGKIADLGIGDYVKKTDADTYYDTKGSAATVQGETTETVASVNTKVDTAQTKADSAYTLAESKATIAEVNAAITNAGHAATADLTAHTSNGDIHVTTADKTKWNAAEQNAKTYADGLNTTMGDRVTELENHNDDYKSYADQAEVDAVATAKAYTDEQVGAIEIPEYTIAKVAEGVAVGEDWYQLRKDGVAEGETIKVHARYDDTTLASRVTTVEGKVTILEGEIGTVQVALSNKLENITTTANGGLKVTGNNQIDIDSDVVFVFDCGDSVQ